jgi:hypothetical protein
MADDNGQVFTSAQAAEALGISTSTLRSWKFRKSDQLQENVHWFKQDEQLYWTQEGIDLLTSVADKTTATPGVADDATLGDADPLQRYENLITAVAAAVAPAVVQRIDKAVLQEIKQAIAQPMKPAECLAVLADLGIKPADPLVLVSGSVAGLLNETTEGE